MRAYRDRAAASSQRGSGSEGCVARAALRCGGGCALSASARRWWRSPTRPPCCAAQRCGAHGRTKRAARRIGDVRCNARPVGFARGRRCFRASVLASARPWLAGGGGDAASPGRGVRSDEEAFPRGVGRVRVRLRGRHHGDRRRRCLPDLLAALQQVRVHAGCADLRVPGRKLPEEQRLPESAVVNRARIVGRVLRRALRSHE